MKFEFIDLGLYIPKQKILVFSDFHLGYEEDMQRKGILVPRFQFQDTIERIDRIMKKLSDNNKKIETIIINGDLKHEFGRISAQEWREIIKLIDLLLKHCEKLIIIKGNHDVILSPILKEYVEKGKVVFFKYYIIEDILFTHGDVLPQDLFKKDLNNKTEKDNNLQIKQIYKKIKTIVIGNEHPAIALQDKGRVERFKCFLQGKYEGKELLVLPSFQLLTIGTDILQEKKLSPYLQHDL